MPLHSRRSHSKSRNEYVVVEQPSRRSTPINVRVVEKVVVQRSYESVAVESPMNRGRSGAPVARRRATSFSEGMKNGATAHFRPTRPEILWVPGHPNSLYPQVSASAYHSRGSPRQQILFYHRHQPHYGFTNFSPHDVWYKGKRYPTSEHLFQSFKFQDYKPSLAEYIRTCSEKPRQAFAEARRFQPEVRPDWHKVNIQKMDETLWHKFNQHSDLKYELLATGNAELLENSDKDSFWGIGADGRGRNELGKALERLRANLRGSSSAV